MTDDGWSHVEYYQSHEGNLWEQGNELMESAAHGLAVPYAPR